MFGIDLIILSINKSTKTNMFFFIQQKSYLSLIATAITATFFLFASFIMFEPIVAHGVSSNDFSVTQEITSEISFLTQPGDVTMSGAINGLTGGTALGTTTFNITTNDPDGYTVSIAFATTTAMQGENINSDVPNYQPGANPDYDFSVATGEAWFAYTVNNETTPSDIDASFKDNGSACGTGGTNTTVGKCWYNEADATGGEQIIDGAAATAAGGATSTIVFQVGVGQNPSPSLETGFYTATATLTALVK